MECIATGMWDLYNANIVDKNLKASHILVEFMQRSKLGKKQLYNKGMEIKVDIFSCRMADFESFARMMGTTFWKVHEILLVVKNRNIMPNFFTLESDVDQLVMKYW